MFPNNLLTAPPEMATWREGFAEDYFLVGTNDRPSN